MSIQDLGALGELVSSIAVLVTLIYVAIQLRETRNALMAQAYQARSDAQQDVLVRVAENEGLASLIAKVHLAGSNYDYDKIDDLSDVQLQQFFNLQQALALRHDNTAHQYYAGYISDHDIAVLMFRLADLLPLWNKLGVRINPSLQRYINEHTVAT